MLMRHYAEPMRHVTMQNETTQHAVKGKVAEMPTIGGGKPRPGEAAPAPRCWLARPAIPRRRRLIAGPRVDRFCLARAPRPA